MRDSLTVLAILVIGVLTAALVGPYLIDWDSHRALIERKLTEAAGTPVEVLGPIDLKVLPRPILRLGDVAVGSRDAGRPRITAAALDAELSLTALMRGQVQVVDTTLEKPRLDLAEAPDGTFGVALPADDVADRVAFEHVGISDGTLALRLADGRRVALSGLDLDGQATSLRGPLKVTGRFGAEGVPFRLATGALDHGHLRVKLHVDGGGLRPSLDLDGTVAPQPGHAGAGFDGSAVVGGALPLDGTPAAVPWRMTAHLAASRDAASASDVELRAGTDMRALIASGDATAAYEIPSARPQAALRLHGAGLDLDRLAVAPENGDIAPPAGLGLVRLLLRLAGDGAGAVSLPGRLDLSAGFDTVTLDGQTLLGTRLALGLGPEPTAAVALSVDGPEGTHLSLDGRAEPGSAPVGPFGSAPAPGSAVFRGRAEARTGDVRRAAGWLSASAPEVAAWLVATVPGRTAGVVGDIEASATGVAARDLSLSLDGSRFAGTLSFTRAVGDERARLFADLSSDALDLDRLPDLSGAAGVSRDLDLDLALSARAVTLAHPSLAAGGSLAPVAAGGVALRLTRAGEALRLERLSLDVDGARVEATASRTGRDARAEAHVSAPQLGPVADALASLLPGPATALLRGRAGALSPVDATLRVEATAPSAEAALAPTRFALAGTAGGTALDAALTPDGSDGTLAADARPVSLTLRAEAPDSADLLRQLGAPAAPGLGAARVEATGRGTLAGGFASEVGVHLGDTALSYAGHVAAARGSGRLSLTSADARPLLAALGLAPSGADAVPADAAGDFGWHDAALDWQHLTARVGGTAAAGDLSLDLAPRRPGTPEPVALRGTLSLDRLPASALLGLAWGAAPAPAAPAPWAAGSFAPPPALPRGEVALRVASLPLRGAFEGRDVALALRTGGGAMTLADIDGPLVGGGTLGGTLTLRRDGAGAALSGRLSWSGIPFAAAGLSGRVGGTQDVAGAGDSPASLVASLSGTGSVILTGASLARTDPAAPARTAALLDARDVAANRVGDPPDVTPPDVDAIRRQLAAELDRAPLPLGDAAVSATLAEGRLRAAPVHAAGPDWTADTTLSVDLGGLALTARTALGRPGESGALVVTDAGPLGGAGARTVDAVGLVEGVQARTIARAQERIDVIEQDIRERAAFNRRLKAIQADQQAARDRAEAEKRDAAARAVAAGAAAKAQAAADAQARADAAAKAAADLQAAAEARRAESLRQRAEDARQRADDARLQAAIQAAARNDAAAKAEADKQRFIDGAVKGTDQPLDLGAREAPPGRPHRPAARVPQGGGAAPSDPPQPPASDGERGAAPDASDPSSAGRY